MLKTDVLGLLLLLPTVIPSVGSNPALGFPGGSVVKNLLANAGDPGSIPGLGRSPGVGNGSPLQYSCLENPMEEAPGRLRGRRESDTTGHLSTAA